MADLLRKPFGTHGKVHDITAQSAGWRYVGFGLYRLRAGESVAEATGDRMNVFEKTPPHCLYVPNGSDWTAAAQTDCVIAVCTAPGKGGHAARRIGPDGITLTERGRGTNTRYINNIAMKNEDYCAGRLRGLRPPATKETDPLPVKRRVFLHLWVR